MEVQYIFKSHIFKQCKKGEHLSTLNFCLSIKFCLLHLGETGCLHHCTVVLITIFLFDFITQCRPRKWWWEERHLPTQYRSFQSIIQNCWKVLKGYRQQVKTLASKLILKNSLFESEIKNIHVPCGTKFSWEFIFANCVSRNLIFAIRMDRLLLTGINFCDF